jgi:hypothetical protein
MRRANAQFTEGAVAGIPDEEQAEGVTVLLA